jgi:hypothetical protein
MKLVIVSPHSFVDVITNSSSELFICETKKTAKAVKEVVEALAALYNAKQAMKEDTTWVRPINLNVIWNDVFREPTTAEFDFNLPDFPRFAEWQEAFNRGNYYSSDLSHLSEPLYSCEMAMRKWNDDNPRPPYPKSEKHTKVSKAYFEHQERQRKAAEEIYAPWNKVVLSLYADLYAWVAKTNNVDLTELGALSIKWPGEHCQPQFENDPTYKEGELTAAERLANAVDHAISWGYSFKKGDVFLWSACDNTIPYDFWPDIEMTFKTQRRHLG